MPTYPHRSNLSQIELMAIVDTTVVKAAEGYYEPWAKATAEALDRNVNDATDILGVQVVTDATFAALEQPGVAANLSKEIGLRAKTARCIAHDLATLMAASQVIPSVHAYSPALRKKFNIPDYFIHKDPVYMGSISISVFGDACAIAGGAHRVLARRQYPGEIIPSIIERSTGLLAISGINRRHFRKAWTELGNPYVLPRHLTVPENDQQEVRFTEGARRLLQACMTEEGGCPAAKVSAPGEPSSTVLTSSWLRLVDFLIPADATTKIRNFRLPPSGNSRD